MRSRRSEECALVTLNAGEPAPRAWTLAMTPLGRDVTAGRADWLAHHRLDRWLGGVHLIPPRPTGAGTAARAGSSRSKRAAAPNPTRTRSRAVYSSVRQRRPDGRRSRQTRREESPGSTGQGAG